MLLKQEKAPASKKKAPASYGLWLLVYGALATSVEEGTRVLRPLSTSVWGLKLLV
jgi:hypothetical protein